MYDTPRLPVKRPQQPVPFAVQRRRSKLACVNCKKRKVRVCDSTVTTRFANKYGLSHLMQCIAPKQPPTNPCARCTRRRLTCEYVVSTEDDSSPPAKSQVLVTPPLEKTDFSWDDFFVRYWAAINWCSQKGNSIKEGREYTGMGGGLYMSDFLLEAEGERKTQNTDHRAGGGREVDISGFAGARLLPPANQSPETACSGPGTTTPLFEPRAFASAIFKLSARCIVPAIYTSSFRRTDYIPQSPIGPSSINVWIRRAGEAGFIHPGAASLNAAEHGWATLTLCTERCGL
ncbi:hypothetical protein C8R44DRAFT_750265 [Mycena epipterygia]|nr:hypothetical protein C8R44DRAFT_750265 [Mycena epipterygia]